MSIEDGTLSSAPVLENSPIQVEPTQEMSGVLLPAIEVRILLWAASIAIGVTLTLTPGFSFSKSLASSGSFSPSTPGAHTVIVPLALPDVSTVFSSPPPQPATIAASSAAASTVSVFIRSPPGCHCAARSRSSRG